MTNFLWYIFNIFCKITSYSSGIALSASISATISFVFVWFYIYTMNIKFHDSVYFIFIFISLWILHALLFGLFSKLKIPSVLKSIRHINQSLIIHHNKIALKPDLSKENLQKLHIYLSRLPLQNTIYLLIWTSVIFVFFMTRAFQLNIVTAILLKQYILIYLITFIIHAIFTYVLGEVFTSDVRISCKKRMQVLAIPFEDKSYSSVKIKINSLLLIFIISLYISNYLSYYGNNRGLIFIFSIMSIGVCLFMVYLIMRMIYRNLSSIEKFASKIQQEEVMYLFTSSLDKEFINLNKSLRKSSRMIRDYELNLESIVKERTLKIIQQSEELQKKDNILQTELKFAADIQKGIIPKSKVYNYNKLSIYHILVPMGVVSGDYLDIYDINNKLGILMADASGHGVPAALITMVAKLAFSEEIKLHTSTSQIFNNVNTKLATFITTQDYLSAFLMIINPDYSFIYSNAGHQLTILYRAETDSIDFLDTNGFLLGALEEVPVEYEEKYDQLKNGDRLILYTDGITEQKNIQNEEYGINRLVNCLLQNKKLSAKELTNVLIDDMRYFSHNSPIKDDYALMVIAFDE